MPSLRINRLLVMRKQARIAGIPFPGEILRANGLWYRNGIPVRHGASYTVSVQDIGAAIRCGNSPEVMVWHPQEVPQCHALWVSWQNVFTSVEPDVPVMAGQRVRQWRDLIRGINANQTTENYKPVYTDVGGPVGVPSVLFHGALNRALFTGEQSDLAGNAFEGILVAYRIAASLNDPVPFGLATQGESGHPRLLFRPSRASDPAIAVAVADRSADGVAALSFELPGNAANWSAACLTSNWSTGEIAARMNAGPVFAGVNPDTGLSINHPACCFGASTPSPGSGSNFTGYLSCAMVLIGEPSPGDFNRLYQFVGRCAGEDLGLPIV